MDVQSLEGIAPWDWPEEAGQVIRSALADRRGEPADRLLAAEMAGSILVMDDAMAEVLLEIVPSRDEDPELRARSAIAFGPVLEEVDMAFPDPDDVAISESVARAIRSTLHRVYRDPEAPVLVRRRVLEASVHCREDWHEAAVRAAYHSEDDDWRLTAVFCMRFVPGFEAEILEALGSGDEALHFQAVRAAGSAAVDGAWRHVRSIVRSPKVDKPLLLVAIEAVASIRPEEARAELADLMLSDDEDIKAAARFALALAGPPADEEAW